MSEKMASSGLISRNATLRFYKIIQLGYTVSHFRSHSDHAHYRNSNHTWKHNHTHFSLSNHTHFNPSNHAKFTIFNHTHFWDCAYFTTHR